MTWQSGVTISPIPTVCAAGDAPGLWIVLVLAVVGAAALVVPVLHWFADRWHMAQRRTRSHAIIPRTDIQEPRNGW